MAGRHAAAVALELPTEAWAEHDGAGEGDHAAHRVDDRRAGEVTEPDAGVRVLEEAARPPGPVTEDRVDEPAHAEAVEQVTLEAGPADHGAGRDGRARVGKGELEEEERHERNAGVERAAIRVGRRGAIEEEELVADDAVAGAEHQGKAERPKQQRAQACVDDALLEDVDDFTSSGEPGLEHHESRLHEEHEECSNEHPGGVGAVDDARDLGLQIVLGGCVREAPDDPWGEDEDGAEGDDQSDHLAGQIGHEEALPVAIREPGAQGHRCHVSSVTGMPGWAGPVGQR